MAASDLARYVSADPTDQLFVAACWDRADALVSRHIGDAEVPPLIRDAAILEVAADLWHRRDTRSGIATFEGTELVTARVSRDPLLACRDLLASWIGPVIA